MRISINTSLGIITGLQHDTYQEFLGIRYAEPPVGELRFEPPILLNSWEKPLDATKIGPMAPQAYADTPPIKLEQSEDCLLLNIWTPHADDQKRPVMVYIHGGGFLIGSASRPRIRGHKLAIRGNVVVVNIQYRLGLLGFLKLEGIASNLGIQDQICALQWVQRNIQAFGGDPNNITLFGESAGSMSVALLMISPYAKGLFHKAIGQSGAINFRNPQKEGDFSLKSTQNCLKILHISPRDIKKLRNLPLEMLMKAVKTLTKGRFLTDRFFYPYPDGDYIPFNYEKAWTTEHAKEIPLLIGTNAEEIPIFGSGFLSSKWKQIIVKFLVEKGIRKENALTKLQFKEILQTYQKHFYFPKYPRYYEYDAILTDIAFWIPTILQAELHCTHNDTYVYLLNYKAPKMNVTPHVMDLLFVFGDLTSDDVIDLMQLSGSPLEQQLSGQIMDAWIQFARSGNPNHPNLPKWDNYDIKNRNTMVFDVPCSIEKLPREELRTVWKSILESK